MAKKQTSKQTGSVQNLFREWLHSFKDVKFQFVTGVLSVALSVMMFVAYLSFFFTGAADKSRFDIPFGEFFTDSEVKVENWMGKLGAFMADVMFNRWFGVASVGMVFILFLGGMRLLGARFLPLRKSLIHTFVLMLWLSISLAFVFVSRVDDQYLMLGGAHGYYVSNWMIALMGYTGLTIFLLVSLIIYLAVSFDGFINWFKGLFRRKMANESLVSNSVPEKHDESVLVEEGEPDDYDEESASEPDMSSLVANEPEIDQQFFSYTRSVTPEIPVEHRDEFENRLGDDNFRVEVAPLMDADVDLGDVNAGEPLSDYDETQELSSYRFPELELLDEHHSDSGEVSNEELLANKERIVRTLEDYKISIASIKATIGPTVTLYEIVPAPGVRISKIKNLEDDIALSLSALGIRIIAPIPGKGTIGIEVPNSEPMVVSMRDIIASKKYQTAKYDLPIAFGKTISNETFVLDLAKAPHMLVAGATGQGKSVGLNAIITSLLYKKHPSQLKFVLVDPKKVELNIYSQLERHFLAKMPDEEEPIITDVQRVVSTLNSLTVEMDSRYDLLKQAQVRNIKEYNHKFVKRQLNPERGHRFLPYIVVIIDEFADLIMTAGKEVELPIARIAQLARAVGIHMIIATQRPSTNIITGVIKANFPTRVAFKVASMIDSRTILDSPGANQLIGRGDMLISQGSDLVRVQCAFVDTPEVEKIVEFIGSQRAYPSAMLLPEYVGASSEGSEPGEVDLSKRDSMFEEAARIVVANQSGSTSLIQRRFSIGYNRAGRIMDQLEAAGVVGPFEGSKARQVLVQDEAHLERLFSAMR
ncbi:S-DNA-T family DNA segregation ATPase FtsK/SpoIIIE [Breznakibacter xylanolyticus]|uniref:S-DNA-T family DNA segregation ATPase FtsK/SpoIIIE n=1 Tax=Breznakibacter xylanolyticus TaxID=990 RepID=A0A2W7N135_9BACT|nr:DNA translocase FtsK [Breznakibacter xylanolyticus]PZX13848.1 S-DNA-T family DNA segregation ATPase FtsK/SpoIIIE [Breznakibacter xylanolyticus]